MISSHDAASVVQCAGLRRTQDEKDIAGEGAETVRASFESISGSLGL